MLLFFRPFKVGQFVEVGGISGTVDNISLFTTHMNTPDNVHIVVPNAEIWGASIKNYSHNETRRIQIDIGIGYGDDIDKALRVAQSVCKADKRVHKDPAPLVAVSNLGDSSVDLLVRVWCRGSDFWALKWGLTKALKEAFDKEGIEIPYPQRVVHKG
jgi:small conductance mechanosensitive channel